MRFTVSRVMDVIERRLTTDVGLAQAVVDVGEVARYAALDGGRPVSLVRIGMVIDALGRYLVDAGVMLYPVVGRELLSEGAFTSKERMVLGRWADDGLIEVTPVVAARAVEVADFTGLPLIVVHGYDQYVSQFGWLRDAPERSLWLRPRAGGAVLTPGGDVGAVQAAAPVAIGKASAPAVPAGTAAKVAKDVKATKAVKVAKDVKATKDADVAEEAAEEPEASPGATASGDAAAEATRVPGDGAGSGDGAEAAVDDGVEDAAAVDEESAVDAEPEPVTATGTESVSPDPAIAVSAPSALGTFVTRGAIRVSSTRVVSERFTRAEPSGVGSALLVHEWRCPEQDCPAFGTYRRIGQPVPRMREGVPACPRHGVPLRNIGPRPPAFSVVVVVDDLPRRRFIVDGTRPVTVGRSPAEPDDDISVAEWLHRAAASWIAPSHLRLRVDDGTLVVTDLSANGTLIWKRSSPEDPGSTERLYRTEHRLGEWDSIELYTGVELVPGRRLKAVAKVIGTGSDLSSVLVDAPTVVMRRPELAG